MIQQLGHDSVSRHVAADPDTIYQLVADVTRTPEFSPEIIDCQWLDGATGPAVGARFKARNKMPNRPPFANKPVVTVVELGKTFAFARTEPFGGTVEWRYDFTPDGTGTLVTESYTVTKPVSRTGWFIIGTLFGRKNRQTDLHNGMTETLDRLAHTAERQPTVTS
jgi:Polyketide cyclase / dehydrase and lipid transport